MNEIKTLFTMLIFFRTMKSQLAFFFNKEAEYEKCLKEKDLTIEYLQKQLINLEICEDQKKKLKSILIFN